ncbi:MAG: DMP19 family protein [Zoogloea sp.]|uniref:DMP19 family protein n=1 Tax=Zoogloea sp. TaxID=49181 RepID=UPI003F2C1240
MAQKTFHIVVSDKSFSSEDPLDILQSNISFVNELWNRGVSRDFVAEDSWCSYYVDYYHSQLMNGGFSQFVFNCDWDDDVIGYLKAGLASMGAENHLALLVEGERLVQSDPDKLRAFFASKYFGTNDYRDHLNSITDRMFDADKAESLVSLNATWLRQHPLLKVMTIDQMHSEIDARVIEMESH